MKTVHKNIGRVFLILGFGILAVLFSVQVFGQSTTPNNPNPSIIDIRRNIPLSDEEPVYKDFYIRIGDSSSIKKNMVLQAVRKITVRDASGTQSYGDLNIPVGQLKVIAVQGQVAVAREYALISRQNEPMLEQIGIMNGDLIDLTGSFIDNK